MWSSSAIVFRMLLSIVFRMDVRGVVIVLMLLCSGVVSVNSASSIRLLVKPFLLLSTHLLLVSSSVVYGVYGGRGQEGNSR